jgi:hypothetical protein
LSGKDIVKVKNEDKSNSDTEEQVEAPEKTPNEATLEDLQELGLIYVHTSTNLFCVAIRKMIDVECDVTPFVQGLEVTWTALPPANNYLLAATLPAAEWMDWLPRTKTLLINSEVALAPSLWKVEAQPTENPHWLLIQIPWAKTSDIKPVKF